MSTLRRRRDGKDEQEEPLLATTPEDVYEEQHTYKNRQLIVHQPFALERFVALVVERWQAFLRAFYQRVAPLLGTTPQEKLTLSRLQAERLQSLRELLAVPYDGSKPEHQAALRKLWTLSFPDVPLQSLKTPYWKNMGWQGDDPGTDFRGAGFFGLENLIYLAENDSALYKQLLEKKSKAPRSEWEYPFAVAGLNITFMLEELLGLRNLKDDIPATPAGRAFTHYLAESDHAFEVLYCIVFELLDKVWLEMRASYMEFGAVMQQVKKHTDTVLRQKPATMDELRDKLLAR